jgi:hypothetical protein
MVGLVGTMPDAHYLSVVPGAVPGSLYAFDGTYLPSDTMRMGAGYWLKLATAGTVSLNSIPVQGQVLALSVGWNMIAGPSCSVASGTIVDPEGILIAGTLYGYDAGYYASSTVDRGKGYWVKTRAAGTVTLSCGTAPRQASDDLPMNGGLSTIPSFTITDASGAKQVLYWNAGRTTVGSSASLSLPPLPPAECFDVRFEGDCRLSEESECVIRVQSVHYPLTFKATNCGRDPVCGSVLVEMEGEQEGRKHVLVNGAVFEISNPNTNRLKLSRPGEIPGVFGLEQNFPNPFNPSTTIRYGLANRSNVTLTLFNTLGQQVAQLVNEEMEAGYHEVQFSGVNLSSGVYLYRIRAGEFWAAKKLSLVK